jgi:hypothetical protein
LFGWLVADGWSARHTSSHSYQTDGGGGCRLPPTDKKKQRLLFYCVF